MLTPGDLLRQIDLPLAALKRRAAFRQISLAPVGRSAALLIGTPGPRWRRFALTVTASTRAPDPAVAFARLPTPTRCATRSRSRSRTICYHDDVHGKPVWRKHMTLRLAEEIRGELAGRGAT